jgi:predicted RND superfamily exporter protein
MLKIFYDRLILVYPKTVLLVMLLVLTALGYQSRKLEIDASAETLILEDDKDLQFTRLVNDRYGSSDFLIISYIPDDDLFSDGVLADLATLRDELEALDGVESVTSILDVPLLESPPRPVKELVSDVKTLESAAVDRELARREFQNSPIYRNLLVSPDLRTTALQVNLPDDPLFKQLLERRNELRYKAETNGLSAAERHELKYVQDRFKIHRDAMRLSQHHNIEEVRAVMARHRGSAELFLGGVSMIADDLISFIKSDLEVFGLCVLCLLALTLWLIFRQLHWVVLPLLCSVLSVVATCGLLGMFGWEVTVISSNFISLQLIITMSVVIHLIVRYREIICMAPGEHQRALVLETVLSMAKPCCFAVLTTVAGFSSLILCDILPVINFGWMMSAGIGISLLLTFILFPAMMMLIPESIPTSCQISFSISKVLGRVTERHGRLIMALSLLLMIGSVFGASRLVVENSFIDYFRESTEIYQGMKVIDEKLGGTTPLDVLVSIPVDEAAPADQAGGEPTGVFAELEAEFEAEKSQAQYWFTARKMAKVEAVHDYLDALPETGKILSLGTMLKVGRRFNHGQSLDNFELALIYNELPETYRRIILSPYVSVEHNQVRFALRVRDSDKNLRRNDFLRAIRQDLTRDLGLPQDNVQLAGLLLLYNNMLQSLFTSQILTMGAVVAALILMFLVLFRSLKISLIAIFPNLLSVGTVLGFMGWAGIPLDMMTITIAAISVGIAVDDTIHYIHRFRREFAKEGHYLRSMHRCHGSIGYAMYYTSVTIVIGFSILVLSNFIPSIYFGVLTVLAMVIALLAALTLLPQLIVLLKPFGPETDAAVTDSAGAVYPAG